MSRVIQAVVIWFTVMFASCGIACLVIHATTPITIVCEQTRQMFLLVFGCLSVIGCTLWLPVTIAMMYVSEMEKIVHNGWMCSYGAGMCIYTAMVIISGLTFSAIALFQECLGANYAPFATVLSVLVLYGVTVGLVFVLSCCKAFTRMLDE